MSKLVKLAAIAAATLSAQPTFAQSLEEITVTARKTEESLQEVPISITAFSADQLLEMGAYSNDDVARMTVNFNTVAQLGRRLDRPVIRGMSAPSTFGEPNASYFVDGAYVAGDISAATLGPIERVEILRGPQSAQFGRATFSGAVNYVTRRPTNDLTGEVMTRAGTNDTYQVSAWGSGPLVPDRLLFFGSLSWDKYGGEWDNDLQPGEANPAGVFNNPPQQGDYRTLGATDTRQATGKLLWLINDDAELTFKLGYLQGDDGHYPQLMVSPDELNCFVPGQDITRTDPDTGEFNLNYFTSPGQYCGVIDWEGRRNAMNLPDLETGMQAAGALQTQPGFTSTGEKVGLQREQLNALIEYAQDINAWNMTVRAAYNTDELNSAYDLDGTPARPLLGQFSLYEEQLREDVSLEFRMATPVEKSVRGAFGVYGYYFEETAQQKSNVGLGLGSLGAATVGTTINTAVFGSLDIDITEKLTFTAEARYAVDTKKMDSPNSCDNPASHYYDPGNKISHEETTDAFTPRLTLNYATTDNSMVYLQAAKGNKPGAFNRALYSDGRDGCQTQDFYYGTNNGLPGDPPIAFVEEEDAITWEIGTKTSWFNNRLIANLAVFYIDWDNLTAFETRFVRINGLAAPQSLGLNAGKANVKGLELETTFAVTDKLVAKFAYGYNNGQYTEYASRSYAESTGIGLVQTGVKPNGDPIVAWDSTVNNLAGAQIPNSSKHNFVTSLAYNDQFTADLGWFARTDFVYDSKKYTSGTNFEQIGERKTWNARTGLDSSSWRLALYVNNILDDQTPSAIIVFPYLLERNDAGAPTPNAGLPPNGYALTPTRGRQYGAEVVWRFGS